MTKAAQSTGMALGALGFLLVCQSANAGLWYAATMNNAPELMFPWSTLPGGPNGFSVFTTGRQTGRVYQAWYAEGWHFSPIYSDPSARALIASASQGPGTLPANTSHVAHIDSDQRVRLTTFNSIFGWITQVVDGNGESTWNNLADVFAMQHLGKLYIFYRESNPPFQGKNVLRCAIFDGTHFAYRVVDGSGNFAEPAAVWSWDGLHVYYHDDDNGTLREAFSSDGVTFGKVRTIDGPGVAGGDQSDVGHHPSAIYFPVNGTVNVFYDDNNNGLLRVAQIHGIDFTPQLGTVDTQDPGTYSAPVYHDGALQVYYTSGGQLRAAWGTGPGAFNWLPLDGPGGIAQYRSPDPMYTPVTAIEANGTAPSVFYEDSVTHLLRNSYWVP